jgi:16S rRNA (guanine527-N7)-methyltransferase
MSDWNALREWSERVAGLPLSDPQLDQLRAYLDVLLFWNRKMALVSQSDPAVILAKHFADSLFVAARCTSAAAVADLGSGAGFPGIPIAIAAPSARVCLIESRAKKASFLDAARRATSAHNVLVCNTRIEALAADPAHRARYAVVTARALSGLRDLLDQSRLFLAPGGRTLAMRSVGEQIPDLPQVEDVTYRLPDGTPRRLLIVPAAAS